MKATFDYIGKLQGRHTIRATHGTDAFLLGVDAQEKTLYVDGDLVGTYVPCVERRASSTVSRKRKGSAASRTSHTRRNDKRRYSKPRGSIERRDPSPNHHNKNPNNSNNPSKVIVLKVAHVQAHQ